MSQVLTITPSGRPVVVDRNDAGDEAEVSEAVTLAFAESAARGMLHLATRELQPDLAPFADFLRTFGRDYLNQLCRSQGHEADRKPPPVPPPAEADLATLVLQAPPVAGSEYLTTDTLAAWWTELDELVRDEIRNDPGGAQSWLKALNGHWRFVGRVTFHLAENKRDPDNPFAFLATFVSKLSADGKAQHEPLGRALQKYAGVKDRQALLTLLVPVERAAERSKVVREMVESGDLYSPQAWSPREAYHFLQDVPIFEESGLIVRLPDWWKASQPPRPKVSVSVDSARANKIGLDALLQFNVGVALDGETLSEKEIEELLGAAGGLVQLKGKWVEVDPAKLREALDHWKKVERQVRGEGLSFFEGMRLLSGAPIDRDAAADLPDETAEWVGLRAGPQLAATLAQMRAPGPMRSEVPGLQAELRPYQKAGVEWLRFLTRLGLGACLADDMGLGKTVQVIALLLWMKGEEGTPKVGEHAPSLLVVPASLIANWKSELERFAPSLRFAVAHPSEAGGANGITSDVADGRDLVITTYGMLTRVAWLRERPWRVAILDEAQAIKNPGARQSKAARGLKSAGRVAMTGTPVENRLGDLWSLFDFLNPGLLGTAKNFSSFVKKLQATSDKSFQPLRSLVGPYILRRLKSDKRIIADLPDKTEIQAWCGLSREQAALYEQTVRDLAKKIRETSGIERRGLVLAQLMRLKQICNHPDQLLGHGVYDPAASGKFLRLREICAELAERQERALVFTQFREMTEPLAGFLAGVFGCPGLTLHGSTPVKQRRELVEQFQREGGPPFFVLSLKAGGTGLNLTAASQVIHFDRWWNPAVENQATDRAFRIGQRRNVLVHKFVCRGTLEERIDALIAEKAGLARDVVEGGERLLTEMPDKELLDFVALDVHKALGEG